MNDEDWERLGRVAYEASRGGSVIPWERLKPSAQAMWIEAADAVADEVAERCAALVQTVADLLSPQPIEDSRAAVWRGVERSGDHGESDWQVDPILVLRAAKALSTTLPLFAVPDKQGVAD